MTSVFVVCAAVGGTVLVLQFLLELVGLGGDAFGIDTPHDLGHDFGHDLGGVDHDFSSADGHGDVAHDSSSGEHGDDHGATEQALHSATWLFRALSLRTVVAALAFFGLAGLAAGSAGFSPSKTLGIALAAGLGALYAVYAMLSGLQSLRAEGTVRINRAVGKEATVYLRIPGRQAGSGKIQINLQNRTMEYLATTTGDAIPTGATVIVTEVVGTDAVQVQTVSETTIACNATPLR
jgi:hypothetical protein